LKLKKIIHRRYIGPINYQAFVENKVGSTEFLQMKFFAICVLDNHLFNKVEGSYCVVFGFESDKRANILKCFYIEYLL
jgi:hypothetical protein